MPKYALKITGATVNRSLLLIAGLLCLQPTLWAQGDQAAKAEQERLATLQKELHSLKNLQAAKLGALEKAEAARWDARYRQASQNREWEEDIRRLEEKYGRTAQALARQEEELMRAQNELREREAEWAGTNGNWEGLITMAKQGVDEASRESESDFPVDLAIRTQMLSQAGELLEQENPSLMRGLEAYFGAYHNRYLLTQTQSLDERASLYEDGVEAPSWRLRLGTVWLGETAKDGNHTQLILRTGSLQGQVFAWRENLGKDIMDKTGSTIREALEGRTEISPPLDVLQNKSLGAVLSRGQAPGVLEGIAAWFRSGGVVMFPIGLVALFAAFLSAGRFLAFARRGTHPEKFMRGLRLLLDQGKFSEARQYCLQSNTSLGDTLGAVLGRTGQDRESAEKTAQEAMLREVPTLEKWMPLIATLAAVAPLMGLLGTVSGMITLFQVITSAGTNDPRILAGGISEALVTTQAGLVIAIPVLLAHGVLSNRLDNINSSLNVHTMEVLNRLWPASEGARS